MVGDEGEATIASSATAKIRMLYSSIRNKGLLYFAIGIWDAMYLHHAPERAGGRLIRCFAKKMWSSWEPMEEVHAVGSFACRCIMAISVQSAILRHTESIVLWHMLPFLIECVSSGAICSPPGLARILWMHSLHNSTHIHIHPIEILLGHPLQSQQSNTSNIINNGSHRTQLSHGPHQQLPRTSP